MIGKPWRLFRLCIAGIVWPTVGWCEAGLAPKHINLTALTPQTEQSVEVVALASDAKASQFLIFVHEAVKPHRHNTHSETLYVLSGRGEMRLANETVEIGAGDFIQVPAGVVHGVRVLSGEPLKVLSMQAPEFTGADREWVTDEVAPSGM